jgi:hypothetical protein
MMMRQDGVTCVNAVAPKSVSFLQQATEILAKSNKNSIKQFLLSNGSPTMPNSSIRMVPADRARTIGATDICGDGQADIETGC